MAETELQPNQPGMNGRSPGENGHMADPTALRRIEPQQADDQTTEVLA